MNKKKKKKYQKPQVNSEKLMVYGGLCDGTFNNGGKTSTAAPNFCNVNRINS